MSTPETPAAGAGPSSARDGREAEADAGKGPIGRRLAAVAAMAAMGLLAIGIGFGTVAMLGSKPAPQAEVAPPPPSPTELGLSEFVARGTVRGRPAGISLLMTVNLPSQASYLILRSRTPVVRELVTDLLEGYLGGDEGGGDEKLRADILRVLDAIIASTRCAELPPATRAEGCHGGQELPATGIAIRRLIRF